MRLDHLLSGKLAKGLERPHLSVVGRSRESAVQCELCGALRGRLGSVAQLVRAPS